MNNYKYMCIDAQYYLRRNWSVICYNDDFNKFRLLESFLWTILKIIKTYPADKVLLLFDKKPYRKAKVIKDYKGSRYLVCEHESELQEKVKKATNPEEKKKLEKELKDVSHEADLFKEMGMAKYEILAYFHEFGLVSLNIPGYEADDLARLISLISEERKERTILVSGDSDWLCMANNNTDVYRFKSKNPQFYNQLNAMLELGQHKLDPFHFYQLNDIYNGGHNDVNLTTDFRKYTIDQLVDKILNNDTEDVPELMAYYKAMDIDSYLPDVKDILTNTMLKSGKLDNDAWLNYRKHFLNKVPDFFPYYFLSTIRKQNPSHFIQEVK